VVLVVAVMVVQTALAIQLLELLTQVVAVVERLILVLLALEQLAVAV
jgi:hypothetical protein